MSTASVLRVSCWIILVTLSVNGTLAASGWCVRLKPVFKTRLVPKTQVQLNPNRDIFDIGSQYVVVKYMETESYLDNEYEKYCCTGYVMAMSRCKPVCPDGCEPYGWCVRPKVCNCMPNYKDMAGKCAPLCPDGCPTDSSCTAPFTCTCREGYSMQNRTCVPVCEVGCPAYASCEAPGRCDCLPGYAAGKGAGVGDAVGRLDCAPLCTRGCPANGVCAEPDVCVCEPGFAMDAHGGECRPVCEEPCPQHSACYRPGECLCEPGYRLQRQPDVRPHCEPVCARDCSEYGKCVAPNTCACLPGYRMQPAATGQGNDTTLTCQPVCEGGCENGFCFRPGTCVCRWGYLMGPNRACAPVCSLGCENGVCVEPEICQCLPGFAFAANSVHRCTPRCEPPCVNGNCAAPNVCICLHNYQPNGTQLQPQTRLEMAALSVASNVCVPSCVPECVHGDCAPANVCHCWPGYELVAAEGGTGTCQPASASTLPDTGSTTSSVSVDSTAATKVLVHRRSTVEQVFHTAYLADNADCLADCDCWVYYDSLGVLNNAKCEPTCTAGNRTQCLDLGQCKCDGTTWAITCSAAAIESGEDDGDEAVQFLCRAAAQSPQIVLTTPLTPGTGSKSYSQHHHHQPNTPPSPLVWYWMSGIIALLIACIATLILYCKWRDRGQTHHLCDNGDELHELESNCDS